jgi:hypothetical protein
MELKGTNPRVIAANDTGTTGLSHEDLLHFSTTPGYALRAAQEASVRTPPFKPELRDTVMTANPTYADEPSRPRRAVRAPV